MVRDDPRTVRAEAARYIPARSEYAAKLAYCFGVLEAEKDVTAAWAKLEPHFIHYNWIHAYPNLAADMLALWYSGGDFTEAMALLAKAGYDVDCNGGLVGNVLGVMRGTPAEWAEPLGDLLETYIKGKQRLSIKALAEKTARLAQKYYPV